MQELNDEKTQSHEDDVIIGGFLLNVDKSLKWRVNSQIKMSLSFYQL